MSIEKPSFLRDQKPEKNEKKKTKLDRLNESGPFHFSQNDLDEVEKYEAEKEWPAEMRAKKDKSGPENSGRRKFLKWGLAAAISGTAAYKSAEWLLQDEGNGEEKTEDETTVEQEQIKNEDIKSISEVLDYRKEGRIEFNMDTVEALRNYWYKQYKENPDMVNSFKNGFKKMGAWKPYLQAEFAKAGWSQTEAQELMYLAIPESHWDTKAMSKDMASGPYQFIPKTAKSYNLKSGCFPGEHNNIDERRDPIKSANACARFLKDLHKASRNDRDLALSGYNGGYIWDYIKSVRNNNNSVEKETEKKEISYREFTGFLEGKINDLRDRIKTSEVTYTVQSGQSLIAIAKKYGKSIDEIKTFNSLIDPNKIQAGQIIRIPNSDKEKEKKFYRLVSDYSQNLVYPAKFDAVIKLIKEGFVDEQKEPVEFKTIISKQEMPNKIYVFTKSDKTIINVGRKFNLNYKDILKANPGIDPRKLRGGEKIIIPISPVMTLEKIGQIHSVSLARLKYLNPSIKKTNESIPNGYEIRI